MYAQVRCDRGRISWLSIPGVRLSWVAGNAEMGDGFGVKGDTRRASDEDVVGMGVMVVDGDGIVLRRVFGGLRERLQ